MERQKESQVRKLLKQDRREMVVTQTKVVTVEVVRTGQIQDLLAEWMRQRGGKDDSEGLGLSNPKVKIAINRKEKCSGGIDLGGTIRNSLLVMLSLRCLLHKQVEMSSRHLHIRVQGWGGRV